MTVHPMNRWASWRTGPKGFNQWHALRVIDETYCGHEPEGIINFAPTCPDLAQACQNCLRIMAREQEQLLGAL